ncbi:MAG: transporter permease, partial [Rhizobacter sp.]|nr:transporter permease [Rhizobacter sp.]
LRMAGRNYGLRGLPFVLQILVPAALPAILSGLKIGWAFAWRTLIAAELVFGASSGQGGLGWYIFQNRNELYTDRVFAGLAMVVLIHSVLWPLALNTYAGFQGVPETLRMAGRNYGLRGMRYVLQILVPAALPAILSGLKIGWAFAWRTLIAAELVFGASSGKGGLGWYIFQNRNELYTDKVFAGLAMVVVIGLLVESLGFATLERLTVRRWGQQR